MGRFWNRSSQKGSRTRWRHTVFSLPTTSGLNNLGNRLGMRFERTGSMGDLNRALLSYTDSWRCSTAPPSIRIRSARQAARILASQKDWECSSQLLQDAVTLLPTISPRSLKHTDKQHMLAESGGLASMAAAISLNAVKGASHALQLLELGRGVIASLLMDMRGDISSLIASRPLRRLRSRWCCCRSVTNHFRTRSPLVVTDLCRFNCGGSTEQNR
jgi:hypothetical protein